MAPALTAQLDTRDPDEACDRLSGVYCPHLLTVVGGSQGFHARQTERGFTGLRLFDLVYGGREVRVDPVPFDDFVLITRPLRGRFAVRSAAEGLVPTDGAALVMDAYGSYQLRWHDSCEVLNIVLDRRAVERIAAELRGFDTPRPVRFQLGPPATAAAGRTWDSVTRFLAAETRLPESAGSGPLVRSQLLRLATAALLEAYPSTFTDGESRGPEGAAPSAVRRAMAYIDLRAGEDIGLTDIAAAARIGVRGLQAAFRRHADTTPLAYLRSVRLHRAHAELRSRAPHETTVAAVAARWGFANPGRFSAEHHRAFGVTPGRTLHGA